MAKRIFSCQNILGPLNPLGSAAATGTFQALRMNASASAAALCDVLEVLISGTASASNIGGYFLVRASTLSTGAASAFGAGTSDGGALPSISALTNAVTSSTGYATTQPTLSNLTTDAKLNLGLNAFGGILRWNAAPTQQWQLSGNTATSLSESVLSNITGAGAQAGATANSHIIYEPY